MVVDAVCVSSDESDSTPCSYPEDYLTAHPFDEFNAINQLMIIQREETVDGRQLLPRPTVHSILNFSTIYLQLTKVLLIGRVGHKDPQQDSCTAILTAPTELNFAANLHLSLTHHNRHPPRTQTSHQLVQHTPSLRFQQLRQTSKL